jgi:hypothetical protein
MCAAHRHASRRDLGQLDRVVLARQDRVGQVVTDLLAVHIERGHKLDIVDVVLAELHVHQTRNRGLRISIPVVMDTLNQRSGTVTHTDDGYTNRI